MSDEQPTKSETTLPTSEATAQSVDVIVSPEPNLADEPERGRPPIRLSSRQIILFSALAVFTVYITWRAKSLETSISKRDEASAVLAKRAPAFSLSSLDGKTVSLSDYAGKTIVISYWASWCGPCKVEMPELREFYNRYHKANSDFEFLAISIDENRSDAEKFAAAEKLPFPVLLDPQSKAADAYSVEGIPTMFVVGKDGKVEYAHTGLQEGMQFSLMRQLGIPFPGMENGGGDKSGDVKE
jgi:peroxiredoxin